MCELSLGVGPLCFSTSRGFSVSQSRTYFSLLNRFRPLAICGFKDQQPPCSLQPLQGHSQAMGGCGVPRSGALAAAHLPSPVSSTGHTEEWDDAFASDLALFPAINGPITLGWI